ncbi:Hexosyltransferase [Meloidogyne graminicola]|uniref:Hexosyltransferase n=1 Tax=Meloidogyne graminicola TaxID=189291 RepID=A0A8S9ZUD8_9BILA|nr:Hexosyltransferase [Meloidogyne graminicola]
MINGFCHIKDGNNFILTQKRITLRHYLWNPRSCFFRIFFAAVICFILLRLIYQINRPLFSTFINNESIRESSKQSINFTIAFSNVQKNYQMEKPEIDPCNGKQIKLLVLIMSRRNTLFKRMGIRKSWAKDKNKRIVIRYVIGGPKSDEENSTFVENELLMEQRKYKDLIRYTIPDGYENLHFKMGAAFQWQQKWCPNAEYIMKTDDDTIVDLPRWEFWTDRKFKKDVEKVPNKAVFFGMRLEEIEPIRDPNHKWYVSVEHFPGKFFPFYMQGASYFGTNNAINLIMSHTKEVIGFNMDDIVFTGTLADIANVTRLDYGYYHFRGGNPLMTDEHCEGGIPTIITYFEQFKEIKEYIESYNKMHWLTCKLNSEE